MYTDKGNHVSSVTENMTMHTDKGNHVSPVTEIYYLYMYLKKVGFVVDLI